MEEGRLIHVYLFSPGEYTVFEAPVHDKENMFWILEDENWFLPIEDRKTAPRFAGILWALSDADSLSEEEQDAWGEKWEDGRFVMGYIDKDIRTVSVHLPLTEADEEGKAVKSNVERKLRGVFGGGVAIHF